MQEIMKLYTVVAKLMPKIPKSTVHSHRACPDGLHSKVTWTPCGFDANAIFAYYLLQDFARLLLGGLLSRARKPNRANACIQSLRKCCVIVESCTTIAWIRPN